MEALERDVGEHLRQGGGGHVAAAEPLGDFAGQQLLHFPFDVLEQALRVRNGRRRPTKGIAVVLHDALLRDE
jgi:hypothetical protein